jgi:membrane protease YdiL (CAAX protease family)
MAPKISPFIRAHPVTTFYLLAFAISWAGWVPPLAAARGCVFFASPLWKVALVLPALGPAGAAVFAVRLAREPGGVGPWWRTLFRWRVGLRWIVIAVVAPPALLWAASAVGLVWSHAAPVARPPLSASGLLVFGLMSLLANPCEEVGWRGYALPRLQARYHAVVATLVVGLMWAAWHVPIFLLPAGRISMAAIPFLPWCVDLMARSFIMTWLFNRSGRSVLVASLFHLVINMSGAMIGIVSYPALAAVEIVVAIGLMSFGRTALAGEGWARDR